MHIEWEKKYLKYRNKYLELKTKYNNLIGGGKILINIYINERMVDTNIDSSISVNINELLSKMKHKAGVQNVIDYPDLYEYEYEINSTKIPIETIKTDFISKIKSDYQDNSTDLIINIYIKKKPIITHHRGANFINKSNMDIFM